MSHDNEDVQRESITSAFWHHFQTKTAFVPTQILKKALSDCGRANPFGIKCLTKNMLTDDGHSRGEILEYVQTQLHLNLDATEKLDFYGKKYCDVPENFKFTSGEVYSIIMIVEEINNDKDFFVDLEIVLEQVFKNILKFQRNKTNRRKLKVAFNKDLLDKSKSCNPDIINQELNDNIDDITTKLRKAFTKINKNLDQKKKISLEKCNVDVVLNASTLNYEASISCSCCEKVIFINKTSAGYWMLGNVSRHISKHFSDENEDKDENRDNSKEKTKKRKKSSKKNINKKSKKIKKRNTDSEDTAEMDTSDRTSDDEINTNSDKKHEIIDKNSSDIES